MALGKGIIKFEIMVNGNWLSSYEKCFVCTNCSFSCLSLFEICFQCHQHLIEMSFKSSKNGYEFTRNGIVDQSQSYEDGTTRMCKP